VSAPCTWAELEQGLVGPQTFSLRTMAERLARAGDLWAALHEPGQSLAAPIEALQSMLSADDWREARAASTRRPRARKPRGGPASPAST